MVYRTFIYLIISLFISFGKDPATDKQSKNEIIVDCNYTLKNALLGEVIPKSVIKQLTMVNVEYFSFDGKLHRGQIIVNKSIAEEIKKIFEFIKRTKFPIGKVIPIVKYKWSDEVSMNDNNTSAFNYRKVKGQKVLSPHSLGLAIDINPLQNPHIKGKLIMPSKASYNLKTPGTIFRNSQLVKEFTKLGWQWGGYWKSSKDYQHFEKP